MFSLREYRQPTHRLPDLLPWAALIDTGVVLQKDGLIQKTLAFRGPDLASSSPSELVAGVARLNNALRRFGSGWTLYVEAQRTIASGYPNVDLAEPRRVSRRRRAPRELPRRRRPLRIALLPHLRLGAALAARGARRGSLLRGS